MLNIDYDIIILDIIYNYILCIPKPPGLEIYNNQFINDEIIQYIKFNNYSKVNNKLDIIIYILNKKKLNKNYKKYICDNFIIGLKCTKLNCTFAHNKFELNNKLSWNECLLIAQKHHKNTFCNQFCNCLILT